MGVQITVRNVPDDVRDELAARAAGNHQSMQEYLLEQLQQLARKPSIHQWLGRVQRRKSMAPRYLTAEDIVQQRDAERR